MKNQETLHLVEGVFNESDAREVMLMLFNNKINFHKLKNWSSNERFGKDHEFSRRTIPELKKEIDKLLVILEEAKANDRNLVITSEIKITLAEK